MKRIAVTGSTHSGRTILANALSAMAGFDFISCPSYSSIAARYGLDLDISKCQWPDSFVYCMGAFTQRIIAERRLEDEYISDGSVLNEICWLKSRYPYIELIYERSMIQSLENVIVDYASNEYDFIFHINSNDLSDVIDQCLKQTFLFSNIKYHIIGGANSEDALNQMLGCLQVKPVLSAKYALLNVNNYFPSSKDIDENCN
jgi:hypothetical protein